MMMIAMLSKIMPKPRAHVDRHSQCVKKSAGLLKSLPDPRERGTIMTTVSKDRTQSARPG
jgi:hypothetical protein